MRPALGSPGARAAIERAQGAAVAAAVGYLRDQVPTARRRVGGGRREYEVADDLIAAGYRHTVTRGIDGEGGLADPQIHDHVVVTGVLRGDGRIAAVASRAIFGSGHPRELGAFYRAALASELQREGFSVAAGTGRDGRYFELAGVGREVRDAFSHRGAEVRAAIGRFRARYGREPERGELGGVKLAQRRAKVPTTRSELESAWRATAAAQRFFGSDVDGLLGGEPGVGREAGELSWRDRVQRTLASQRAIVNASQLRATVLEQGVGEAAPGELLGRIELLVREGTCSSSMTAASRRARFVAPSARSSATRGISRARTPASAGACQVV